jgi:hypothetical protein
MQVLITHRRRKEVYAGSFAAVLRPVVLVLSLTLSACQEPPRNVESSPDPAAAEVRESSSIIAAPEAAPFKGVITFDGLGPAAFGAGQEQVRMAWGRDLDELPPEPAGCYYLMPKPSPPDGYRIAFMIEGGRFSRIDVRAEDTIAPGGGRVGMSAEEIQALYSGRIEERAHKYVEGGKYLRIRDEAGGDGVLLFATDAHGRVTEWRIGVPPQVDYVEGCS